MIEPDQCPSCESDRIMYRFTAGELGLEVWKCLDCEHEYWWNGERVVADEELSIA